MCHAPRFRGEAPAGLGFGIPSRSRQLFVTTAVLLGRASDVRGDRGDANRYLVCNISLSLLGSQGWAPTNLAFLLEITLMGFSKTPTLDRFSRVTLRSSDGSILAEYPSLHDKKNRDFPAFFFQQTQLPKIQLDFERLRDFKICSNLVDLVGGLEHSLFSIYWEFHHPN